MTDIKTSLSTIEINGVTYAPVSADGPNTLPSGNRCVVVIDRGWIFAGDTSYNETTQEYYLSNATWVFRWESVGFDGVISNPKQNKVTLKKMDKPVVVPKGSVIFSVPVDANWGL
jgi:hypothetical protein